MALAGVWRTEIPEEPEWVTWEHRSLGNTHCEYCSSLDGCWFSILAAPTWPLHLLCRCVVLPLPYSKVVSAATASSDYSKYNPYLFNVTGAYEHGKEKMLNSWGYTADDSVWLQKEIELQGIEKYIAGEYTLGKLDGYGQRINIRIKIPRKVGGGTASFVSGWLVHPGGHITLTTPWGGK